MHHEMLTLKGQEGECEGDQVPQTEPGPHTRTCTHSSIAEPREVVGNQEESQEKPREKGEGPIRRKGHTSQESWEFPSPISLPQILDLFLGSNLTTLTPDLCFPGGFHSCG